jgi:hypothetical protein
VALLRWSAALALLQSLPEENRRLIADYLVPAPLHPELTSHPIVFWPTFLRVRHAERRLGAVEDYV